MKASQLSTRPNYISRFVFKDFRGSQGETVVDTKTNRYIVLRDFAAHIGPFGNLHGPTVVEWLNHDDYMRLDAINTALSLGGIKMDMRRWRLAGGPKAYLAYELRDNILTNANESWGLDFRAGIINRSEYSFAVSASEGEPEARLHLLFKWLVDGYNERQRVYQYASHVNAGRFEI